MTMAAGNAAGRAGDKEKVEKRRALGRGLESLLPGPRVVGGPGQSGGSVGKQQVPHFVRNDEANLSEKANLNGRANLNDKAALNNGAGDGADVSTPATSALGPLVIQAVAADAAATAAGQPGAPATHSPAPQTSGLGEAESITIYAQAESRMPPNLVVNLAIADIDKNPFQTRFVDDDEKLEELSDSIKANGVVQPIMVRPGDQEGRYILVLGERRLLASKKAGKTTIPALVRRVSLQQAAEMTIIENLQREDLSALEQAEAFRVLSKEFSLTQAQIGERVGLSRESVSNYMRLLKLPLLVMEQLAHKQIGFSEAKELLKLEDPELIQKTADYIVAKHLTLDQVETLIMRMTGLLDPVPGMPGQAVNRKKSGARWVDPNVKAAQLDLERMLGVRVRIRDRKGKGKIVIEYHTVDDYERVVEMLRGKK
jgi:ParB family transcriptional regulator, chromosome partitioning protein